MNILDELAEYAKERVRTKKEALSLDEVRSNALSLPTGTFEFEKALKKENHRLYDSALTEQTAIQNKEVRP